MAVWSPIPRGKLWTLTGKGISELLTDHKMKEKKVYKSTYLFKKSSVSKYATLHYYCYTNIETKEKYLFTTTQDPPYVQTLTLAMSGEPILLLVIWL